MALAERTKVPLAGGDTAESPSGLAMADIVLLGEVKRGQALLRSGARAGDLIYVTGALGGAAAELLALKQNPGKFQGLRAAKSRHPHLYPESRIEVGRRLTDQARATAAIDISDGLSTDLRHVCEQSQLAAEIDADEIPVDPMAQLAEAAQWTASALDLALHGGEDYELLFTAPPQSRLPSKIAGVAVQRIGRMTRRRAGVPIVSLLAAGTTRALERGGWEHFR
jgi:thiamine-monophosphate kinase